MTSIPRCRSRKHDNLFGGCGDPRCPEGRNYETALKNAIEDGAFDAFFDHAAKARITPYMVTEPSYSTQGFMEIMAHDPKTKQLKKVRAVPHRPAIRAAVEAIDRESMIDFDSLEEFKAYIDETYDRKLYYDVVLKEPLDKYRPWGVLGVHEMWIPADLRGLGISRHLKRLVCRFADRHGYLVSGTPTNRGDGTTEDSVELPEKAKHRENALRHRERLVRAYYRNGYVDNPCWSDSQADWLTGEYQVHDQVTINHFTDVGRNFLANQGQYVRFPNGKVPKGMLKPGKTFDALGYRAPRGVLDDEEAYELRQASWEAAHKEAEHDAAVRLAKRAANKAKKQTAVANG